MFLLPATPSRVCRWAWDETPPLRPRNIANGLAVTMTGQFLATYFGNPVAAAANAVTGLVGAWLIVSFFWFVINLFRAKKGLYLSQQEQAEKEFDGQTKLNNQ
jgi:hypothetical protein